jgi:hypothetical protein
MLGRWGVKVSQKEGLPQLSVWAATVADVNIAPLIVSIVAVLVSAGSVFYARRLDESARALKKSAAQAADAATVSADAAQMSMLIESERRHQEQRPRLTARVTRFEDDLWQLHVALDINDSPLSDLTVQLHEGQGIAFEPGRRGVRPPVVRGGLTLCAVKPGMFGADLLPGDSLSWWVTLKDYCADAVKMDVRCSSGGCAEWRMSLLAPVEARPADTIRLR